MRTVSLGLVATLALLGCDKGNGTGGAGGAAASSGSQSSGGGAGGKRCPR